MHPKRQSSEERMLTQAGDGLMAASVGLTVVNGILGQLLGRQGAVPVESGTQPTAGTPAKAAGLQRAVEVVGNFSVASGAASWPCSGPRTG